MARTFLQKITVCLLAGLVLGATFLRLGRRFFIRWISPPVVIIVTLCILLAAIAYAIKWALQKNQDNSNRQLILAFWQAVIRYGIAIDLITLGLQKFFGLQFSMPLGLLDLPFSSFSGEDLTFAYFAHSFAFVVIIGSLQIAGSVLLLFSRTKLFGTIILLPVMLNIVLINACYKMETGELVHSSLLLAALICLLFSEYNRLVTFFFRTKNQLPSLTVKNNIIKNSLRYSAIGFPVLLIATYGFPERHPALIGKYRVSQLTINQQKITPACEDSVLTVVYLDQNADCVFEYNDQKKRLIGNFHLDESTNRMTVVWRYPAMMHDTLFARISTSAPHPSMVISGKMGNQFLQMELVKEIK